MKTRKYIEEKAGVSAVIGVILMLGVTVAISGTVYYYVSNMTNFSANTTPNITFLKQDHSLLVSYVAGEYEWEKINCSSATGTITITHSNLIKAGQTISDLHGTVTIVYDGKNLLGEWSFD